MSSARSAGVRARIYAVMLARAHPRARAPLDGNFAVLDDDALHRYLPLLHNHPLHHPIHRHLPLLRARKFKQYSGVCEGV